MKYTRIYSTADGESAFEAVQLELVDNGLVGHLSEKLNVKSLQFRENKADYNWDFHNAPERQFIILLDGAIEIEISSGEKRIFKSGDVLLVEDLTGKGHRTKNITNQTRNSLFIQI